MMMLLPLLPLPVFSYLALLDPLTPWQQIIAGFIIAALSLTVNTYALVAVTAMKTKVDILLKDKEEKDYMIDALCLAFTSHTGITVNGKDFRTKH